MVSRRGGIALVLALGLLSSPAFAPAATFETLTGEIVDLACYIPHPNNKGNAHKKCAETCVKKGLPMGLLTDDQQVYLLLENHDNAKPYNELKQRGAQTVTIEGTKASAGGVQGFVVEAIKQ